MKKCIHRIATGLLLVAVALVPALGATAAEPIAIVSVSSLDESLSDVEYLLEATGTDAFGQFFMPQVKAYLQGLNTEKPLGMSLSFDGVTFQPLVFLPVDDLDSFLSQMEDTLGEPADAGDGILELQGPETIFLKEQGGWAFIAQDVETLDDLPADPSKLLEGLHRQYDVAIRGYFQNIPEQYREMLLGQMTAGFEQGFEDNEDEEAKKMAEAQIAQVKRMFDEGDAMTFGWNVDPKSKETYFETTVTAKAGTDFAKQMSVMSKATTKYSGFIVPNAAISGNFSGVVEEDQVAQMRAMLSGLEQSALNEIDEDDDIDNDAMRAGAKKLVSGVFEVLNETVATGKLDSATSVLLEDSSITIATAAHVADGADVEKLAQDLVKMAKQSDEVAFSKEKFNAGTHNGVRLHELAIPIPDEEYVSEVLGGELEVCIGAADNDIYVVVGSNPVSSLKKMIDKSKASGEVKASPFNATVKLAPILRFAEAVEGEIQVSTIAEMLEDSGNDHVKVRASAAENGAAYRFTIEEGVLKAIGQAVQMQMAQGF